MNLGNNFLKSSNCIYKFQKNKLKPMSYIYI